jgi:ankyrin repeat protein
MGVAGGGVITDEEVTVPEGSKVFMYYNESTYFTNGDINLGEIYDLHCTKDMDYLIGLGMDIHYVCNKHNALTYASYNNDILLVKYLVEKGIDIHNEDDWAFRLAVSYNHIEIVKYLLEKGANINAGYGIGLFNAVLKGYKEIVSFMVENGAEQDTYSCIEMPDGSYKIRGFDMIKRIALTSPRTL